MHSSKLDALLIFQCCAPLVLGLRLFFCCEKNRRPYNIADVAKLSFLAWTRNLMILACRMCFLFVAGICAVIEIRSLVLARDDGVVGTCVS